MWPEQCECDVPKTFFKASNNPNNKIAISYHCEWPWALPSFANITVSDYHIITFLHAPPQSAPNYHCNRFIILDMIIRHDLDMIMKELRDFVKQVT